MRAISLWQPWASLIFTGDKKHETRSFRPPEKVLGHRIAIHAAQRIVPPPSVGLGLICEREFGVDGWRDLPRGVILGTVRLLEAYPTERGQPDVVDRLCGDWTPGRFAWWFDRPERLAQPIPWKGRQGWFEVEVS